MESKFLPPLKQILSEYVSCLQNTIECKGIPKDIAIKKNKTKANKQLAAGKTVKSGVNEASGFLLQREKLLMSC